MLPGQNMKKIFLCILLLTTSSLIVFRNYWTFERFFCGSDFFQQIVPLINYQSDALRSGSWPLWNPYLNFGFPWLDHYLSTFLFPSHLLLGLLGFGLKVAQIEMLTWVIISGVGVYATVRTLGYSSITATALAMCFMFSGPMLPLPNWSNQLYNACCFPWLICGYLRATQKQSAYCPTAIIAMALSLLGGYASSTMVGLYLFGLFVVLDTFQHRNIFLSAKFLGLNTSISVLLALPKIAPMIAGMHNYPRLVTEQVTNTNWGVMTASSLLSLLVPVKFYFSLYGGSALVIALVYAALKRRITSYPLLIAAIASGWLLISNDAGTPSLLRQAANLLPFMKPVRLEFMYWYYPLVFITLYAAAPLNEFIENSTNRYRILTIGTAICITSFFFFAFYAVQLHLLAFIVQVSILVAWCFCLAAVPKKWQILSVACLVCLEFSFMQARVAVDKPYERAGDILTVSLHDQNWLSHSVHDDVLVNHEWSTEVFDDANRPSMTESLSSPFMRVTPPLSTVKGIVTIDPIPNEYRENWADAMNQKKFNGVWYNPQESSDFIRLRQSDGYRWLDGKWLYGYSGSPVGGRASLVSITGSEFVFHTHSSTPGTLILRQMFDRRWGVSVDGIAEKINPAEGYFMEVALSPGDHEVRFNFVDGLFNFSLVVSLATMMGMCAYAIGTFNRSTISAKQSVRKSTSRK